MRLPFTPLPASARAWAATASHALLDAWSVLSPVSCAGCGGDDRALCAACKRSIEPCLVTTTLANDLDVVSALRYEHNTRRVILAFKEQGRTDVAGPLAHTLAAAFAIVAASGVSRVDGTGGFEIVTIPPRRAAYRRRGYDPVLLLLRRSGVHTPERVLRRVRHTERQKTLGREARGTNLTGSLQARFPLPGRRFVLVDDVMTTGATLLEAARAIRESGGEVVSAITLAFTPKHFPDIPSTSL